MLSKEMLCFDLFLHRVLLFGPIITRMSNELEHARKARIVLGSSLDELFDPSLWSLFNPILKISLQISIPKAGTLPWFLY